MPFDYTRDFIHSETITAGNQATLISERWPQWPGEIFALGLEVSDYSLWAQIEFQILINGVPVIDYGSVQDRIAPVDLTTAVDIPIPAYALIEVIAKNNSASNAVFIARLRARMKK